MFRVYPQQYVPELIFQTVDGNSWDLNHSNPEFMTMIVCYRGYHCPVCRKYLTELEGKLEEFTKRGIDVVAVSCDNTERAKKAKDEWALKNLALGCNLNIDTAQTWGLFVSRSIKEGEPDLFTEPGLFLVDSNKKLYYSSIQTAQFARPHFDEILKGLDYVEKEHYPARGEVMEAIEPVGQPR